MSRTRPAARRLRSKLRSRRLLLTKTELKAMATQYHREALAMAREHGATLAIVLCIDGLAGVAAAGGQAERAARLLGWTAAIRARIGAPLVQPERADVDRAATAAAALGGKAFDRAYRQGHALDLESAMKQAGELSH